MAAAAVRTVAAASVVQVISNVAVQTSLPLFVCISSVRMLFCVQERDVHVTKGCVPCHVYLTEVCPGPLS